MAGIQPEQEQEQESHVLPPSGSLQQPDAANSEPNPPALTQDKTPATSCNLLSWFRHPLATFTASLKRRRCASSGDSDPKAGRKKKAQIVLGDEAAEAKARQEKKNKAPGSDPELLAESIPKAIGGATTAARIVDCLNDDNDDDVYVKKEEMVIAGKEEKANAKEQQGSPENLMETKWVGETIDDNTGGNNHKVAIIMSPNNKHPESAPPITIEEAAAAHPVATAGSCWEMNQQLAAGIQDVAENAEEAAAPETEVTAVTGVSGIREIK